MHGKHTTILLRRIETPQIHLCWLEWDRKLPYVIEVSLHDVCLLFPIQNLRIFLLYIYTYRQIEEVSVAAG